MCGHMRQSIQILTFYTAQSNDIRKLDTNIMVSSVDAFQGQEADIVILSLTARKSKLSDFMVNPRRMCCIEQSQKRHTHSGD